MADHGNGSRVLIVDDNVELAENIAELLALDGFATEVAASAEEALPRALGDDVAVIVTDFLLPGITGAELIVRVRRARADVRCVVISAHNDDATVRKAEAAGARFLAKPLDLGRLTDVVRGADGIA